MEKINIAIIGFGFLGKSLYNHILSNCSHINIQYIWSQSKKTIANCNSIVVNNMHDIEYDKLDLVIEVAHPSIIIDYGVDIIKYCSFMPLSLTAFAQQNIYKAIVEKAQLSQTTLYIAKGANIDLKMLHINKDKWESVQVITTKHPQNLGVISQSDNIAKTLYTGSTWGICKLYPRNVNSHAAIALATIGFDKTQSILISDPQASMGVLRCKAISSDLVLDITRKTTMVGVSGTAMISSIADSLTSIKSNNQPVVYC
jgi:aspartate dehydrogenase